MTWMPTYPSGTAFDFLAAMRGEQQKILLRDVAWSLAHICRFTGHVPFHVSVAEHSLIVLRIVQEDPLVECMTLEGARIVGIHALTHDTPESLTNDISRPVKQLARQLGVTFLDDLDDLCHRQIRGAFGIPEPTELELRIVHAADNAALSAEKSALLPPVPQGMDWQTLPPPDLHFRPRGLSAQEAYDAFMKAAIGLGIGEAA